MSEKKSRRRAIWKCVESVLLFEFLYKTLFALLLLPGFGMLLRLTFGASKLTFYTPNNYLLFLRQPLTILVLLLIFLLLSIYTLLELVSLSLCFRAHFEGRQTTVFGIFINGLRRTIQLLKNKKNRLLPVVAFFHTVFLLLYSIATILNQVRLTSELLRQIRASRTTFLVITLLLLFLIGFILSHIYAINDCALTERTLKQALRSSRALVRQNFIGILLRLLLTNVLLIVGTGVICLLILFAVAMVLYLRFEAERAVATFFIALDDIRLLLSLLAANAGILLNHFVLTRSYLRNTRADRLTAPATGIKATPRTAVNEQEAAPHTVIKEQEATPHTAVNEQEAAPRTAVNEQEAAPHTAVNNQEATDEPASPAALAELLPKQSVARRLVQVALVLYLIGILVYFAEIVQNGTRLASLSIYEIGITSHRGYSAKAPENTLPALEAAIDGLADFAEIDVQLTLDQVPVLLHDSSLRRTTGVNRYIWSCTYDELAAMDAGAWFSEAYVGTRIPSLEEVFVLCKGKIKLNIELKAYRNATALVDAVLALIEEYEFENQCIISSMDYSILELVKERMPELRTGYIMNFIFGEFYSKAAADFFSIRSSFVTAELVKTIHEHGKEVHAWTVNTEAGLRRMQAVGVDNIITDNPLLAIAVIYGEDYPNTFRSYIHRIFQ